MGKTIIEKILGSHSGKSVSAGELVVADVDLMLFPRIANKLNC